MGVDPSKLRIDLYPTGVLRQRAGELEVNDEVKAVAARMIDLMHKAEGIGLAGPQVGLPWRIFVCHVPPSEDRELGASPEVCCETPEVFINPEIVRTEGEPEPYDEGCLSLPGIQGEVFRPPTVTMAATGLDGERFERIATGLLGRCWQHEFDHLEGVLIIDKMSERSLSRASKQIRMMEKRAR